MLYTASVHEMSKMLRNLLGWLDKAVAHAETKKFDPANLLTARLAPDQYPLTRQIQAACDAAKFTAARLLGREAPKHPDTETTLEELQTRVRAVLDYLSGFREADFEGAADRSVELPFIPGKAIKGVDYVLQMASPNFFFHITTAYAILRHNGVDIGKRDFIGDVPLFDAPSAAN